MWKSIVFNVFVISYSKRECKNIYVRIKNNTLETYNAFCLLPHSRVSFMFLSLMRNSIYISVHFYTYTKSEKIYLLVQTQFSVLVI